MTCTPPAEIPTLELMSIPLVRWTRHEVVDHVFRSLANGRGGSLGTLNLDYLRRCVREPAIGALFRSYDLLVADGMPLLWAARLQGDPLPDRVAGSDLVWLVGERAAAEGRSLYLLGGNEGAAEGAGARLRERWPTLHIAGFSSPRVSPDPTADELAALEKAFAENPPDVVYVAFGAPKEERIVAHLRARFPAIWWIGIGISLSFMSGEIQRAPLWMQRAGVEWLHRLAHEPGRLARRYLLEGIPFAARLLAHAAATRLRGAASPARGGE